MQTRIKGSWMFALPFIILGGVTLSALPAYALITQDTAEYTIKRTYAAKTTDHYRIKMGLTVDSAQFSCDLDAEMRYKEVAGEEKDGEFKLSTQFLSGIAKVGGMEVQLPEEQLPPSSVRTIKENKIVKRVVDNPNKKDEGLAGLLLLSEAILPTKAVKAGDKWDVEFEDPNKKGVKAKIGSASLVGKEKLKDIDTVKISWKVTISENKDGKEKKLEFEGDTNIDIKTGRSVQTKIKAQANIQEGIKIRTLQIELLTEKEVMELDKK
ncbi:MAG: hypothetical protein NT023_22320 [Armatimonadetes bacterium]|nr:hypothetical protein [Armatimonadota bacterium]